MEHKQESWYGNHLSNGQGLVYSEHDGKNIAVVYDEKHTDLIAAAPEMASEIVRLMEENRELRKALKGLVALDFFPHGGDPGECMSMCPVCQALDNARAALASGEGEKP